MVCPNLPDRVAHHGRRLSPHAQASLAESGLVGVDRKMAAQSLPRDQPWKQAQLGG